MTDHKWSEAKIAVLLGGNSAEREVSLASGNAVYHALIDAGFNAHKVDPKDTEITALVEQNVDCAFIMLHGRGGEDGSIQGALQTLNIPFTGSGVLGSALAMDKIKSKQIWQSLGLPTARYLAVEKADYSDLMCTDMLSKLGGEVMVKPAQEGSSIGMAKVNTPVALQQALKKAFDYDHHVLLEQYIVGEEYTVGILDGQPLPSIRMQTPHEFYDYSAKYQSNSTEYFCPSGLDDDTELQLAAVAEKAFKALDAKGWGRVDFMRDANGEFYLLEANTVPGMTEKSLVPMAAKQAGLSFTNLVVTILNAVVAE